MVPSLGRGSATGVFNVGMSADELPEPEWAKLSAGFNNQAQLQATTGMHNALLKELRMLLVEQRRTNQLLEWLGTVVAQQKS